MITPQFVIKPQNDIPIDDADLLNHGEIIDSLVEFLKSENLTTPLSIALQGEWGSGKTSILRTLEKKLSSEEFQIVFFEAWKHEYASPALALVNKIIRKFTTKKETLREILKKAIVLFLKRTVSQDVDELIKIIIDEGEAASSLTTLLEQVMEKKLENKKLVVMIDDLDRCDVKNSLMVLALVKLFLDIKNCICIAAVDFKRLEDAWNREYGFGKTDQEGRSYFEKIFQIAISIPTPSEDNIRQLIRNSIDGDFSSVLVNLLAKISDPNPRSIKRMINKIIFRSVILKSEKYDRKNIVGPTTAIFWTLLEEILTRKGVSHLYYKIGRGKGFVGYLKTGNSSDVIKKINGAKNFPITLNPSIEDNLRIFFRYAQREFTNHRNQDDNFKDAIETLHALTREL